jgi:hypothetical protein
MLRHFRRRDLFLIGSALLLAWLLWALWQPSRGWEYRSYYSREIKPTWGEAMLAMFGRWLGS